MFGHGTFDLVDKGAFANNPGPLYPDGTATGVPPLWVLTVGHAGSFFNATDGHGGVFITIPPEYGGGTTREQGSVLTHELGHLLHAAGFLENDSDAVRQVDNNAMVDRECRVLIDQLEPRIEKLSPSRGQVDTTVVITGRGFGAAQGSQRSVTYNGVTATPTLWSKERIDARVPAGATTGPVVVHVHGVDSTSKKFTAR